MAKKKRPQHKQNNRPTKKQEPELTVEQSWWVRNRVRLATFILLSLAFVLFLIWFLQPAEGMSRILLWGVGLVLALSFNILMKKR